MASHREIEDRAAAWLAQRDSGCWSPEDQSHLAHWLEESIAHRVAFLRLEDVWDETRRLKALGAGRGPGVVPPPGQWRSTPFFDSNRPPPGAGALDGSPGPAAIHEAIEPRDEVASGAAALDGEAPFDAAAAEGAEGLSMEIGQFEPTRLELREPVSIGVILPADERARQGTHTWSRRAWRSTRTQCRSWAIAASLLFALGIGSYIFFSPAADRYSTPIGGIATVPLPDGSNITLNTASRIRVHLTPKERLIDLQGGEAFFKVAKDPRRPFVVQVGDKRVVAVGTQFSVRRDGRDIRVVVTEGTVRLESVNSARSQIKGMSGVTSASAPGADGGVRLTDWSSGSVMPVSTSLPAGTIARLTEDDVLVENETVPQAEELLSWRQGYLRFHDTTLAEAIAEFNRYNAHTIAIDDPTVASIRISGTFRPTNYEAFVRLLRDGFSIRAEDNGERIILTKN